MRFSLLSIITISLYMYLFIDTLNGLLIRNYSFSFSSIYKAIILVLMIIYLLKNKIYIPILIVGFFTLLILLHVVVGINSSLEIFWIVKFFMIVASFYFFKLLIEKNKFYIVKQMFLISFSIVSLNMFIGALGYGYAQYGRNDIGTRGLFYAGNEVGVLLIVSSIFFLSYFLLKKQIKSYLLLSLLILILAILLTSKTALLGNAVLIFILPLINLITTKKGWVFNKVSFSMVGISTIIFLFLVPFAIYYALYEMNLMARLSYWVDKVDYITLFYSGRNLLADDIYKFLVKDNHIFNMLFGYGYDKIISVAGRSVELDIVDLFMLFGGIGVVLIYGFFLKELILNHKKNSKIYPFKPYVQFGIVFILLLSISSGHVINSGLAGIMIGALMSLNYVQKENI